MLKVAAINKWKKEVGNPRVVTQSMRCWKQNLSAR